MTDTDEPTLTVRVKGVAEDVPFTVNWRPGGEEANVRTTVGGGAPAVVKVHVESAASALPATSLTPVVPPLTVAV